MLQWIRFFREKKGMKMSLFNNCYNHVYTLLLWYHVWCFYSFEAWRWIMGWKWVFDFWVLIEAQDTLHWYQQVEIDKMSGVCASILNAITSVGVVSFNHKCSCNNFWAFCFSIALLEWSMAQYIYGLSGFLCQCLYKLWGVFSSLELNYSSWGSGTPAILYPIIVEYINLLILFGLIFNFLNVLNWISLWFFI